MKSAKNVKLLKNYVLFQCLDQKTKSGIVMPQNFRDIQLKKGKYLIGQVKKVGPEVRDLKPGFYIIFNQYSIENNYLPNPGEYYIIKETEVLGYFLEKPSFVLRPDEWEEK